MSASQTALACCRTISGSTCMLSAAALVLGLAISAPLVVLARRSARVRWPVLAFVSVIQTVPSLALLALFYPLLLALSSLSQNVFGHGFRGARIPALAARTHALFDAADRAQRRHRPAEHRSGGARSRARRGHDAAAESAAHRAAARDAGDHGGHCARRPCGSSARRRFRRPSGRRVSATTSSPGLQIENWVSVLFGCVERGGSALITDQLLALVENGVATRRPRSRVARACVARRRV